MPRYKINSKRWKTLDKFQRAQKKDSLKSLSAKEGLQLVAYLHQFVCDTIDRKSLNKLSLNKANLLASTHSIFNKVKV